MPDDDLGTVNIKPRKPSGREVDALRQRYAEQRDILGQLAADAPSDHLAREYVRVKGEIETALAKLEALDLADATAHSRPAVTDRPAGAASSGWSAADLSERKREFSPSMNDGAQPESRARLFLIPFVGLLLLMVLGYFVWRSFNRRPDAQTRIVEQPIERTAGPDSGSATIRESTGPRATPANDSTSALLTVRPESQEFGTITKGTRAARQYEIVNGTSSELIVKVTRSACRCMYYEYIDRIPAKGKATLTVTVDGTRAKRGELRESVEIVGKTDQSPLGEFEVVASIE